MSNDTVAIKSAVTSSFTAKAILIISIISEASTPPLIEYDFTFVYEYTPTVFAFTSACKLAKSLFFFSFTDKSFGFEPALFI